MRFLFDNGSFSYETLRTIGYAPYGGADIGEVVTAARSIPEGDEEAWFVQWLALADRVAALADASLAAGRRVSAREAYLRASNYYRVAEFYERDDPDHNARAQAASAKAVTAFERAAALLPQPAVRVAVPFEGTTLPGWWLPADAGTADPRLPGEAPDPSRPRPVLLSHGGFDSTGEELYFSGGAAAARRGYHSLLLEGPGQGSVLRDQHLRFRPDWEVVVTAAVDWLVEQAGTGRFGSIDTSAIALMGMSMGGLLAGRAAAFEHRIAALITYDGVYSMPEAGLANLPDAVRKLHDQHTPQADAGVNAAIRAAMAKDTQARWTYLNGMWTLGVGSPVEMLRAFEPYTMNGFANRIQCPTLVLDAQNDLFFRGQAETLRDAITAPVAYHLFPEAEGSGEHCQSGAMSEFHQVAFDWLDDVLTAQHVPALALSGAMP